MKYYEKTLNLHTIQLLTFLGTICCQQEKINKSIFWIILTVKLDLKPFLNQLSINFFLLIVNPSLVLCTTFEKNYSTLTTNVELNAEVVFLPKYSQKLCVLADIGNRIFTEICRMFEYCIFIIFYKTQNIISSKKIIILTLIILA